MFAKFNLKMSEHLLSAADYASDGNVQFVKSKTMARTALDKYLRKDGSLDAAMIESDWFPEIEADVFISHSHKDKKLAINLAGYLS